MLRSYYIFLEKLSKQRVIYGLSFLIIITCTAAEAATSVESISPILYTKSAHFLRYTLYIEWLARYDMALETRSLLWSQITEQTKRGILDIGTSGCSIVDDQRQQPKHDGEIINYYSVIKLIINSNWNLKIIIQIAIPPATYPIWNEIIAADSEEE